MKREREEIFSGKLLKLQRLKGKYEVIKHPGAVVILPVLPDNKIILIRQFRPAVNEYILELPAGLLEPNEEPIESGKRELLEETGYSCRSIKLIQKFFSSPGYSNEELYLFQAEGLKSEGPPQEKGLEKVIIGEKEIKEGLQKGIFNDAKTIIGLHFFLQEINKC